MVLNKVGLLGGMFCHGGNYVKAQSGHGRCLLESRQGGHTSGALSTNHSHEAIGQQATESGYTECIELPQPALSRASLRFALTMTQIRAINNAPSCPSFVDTEGWHFDCIRNTSPANSAHPDHTLLTPC